MLVWIHSYTHLYLGVFNFSFSQLHVAGELTDTYPEALQLAGKLLHHLSSQCLHWCHVDYLQSNKQKQIYVLVQSLGRSSACVILYLN